MIARGYIRVSTDEQAKNGDSIPAQKKILDALAVVKGYDDFECYVDDGYSGKNLNRPQMQKLLDECRQGHVDAVLVWKLDRLSRSLRDTLTIIEEIFEPNKVSLISATESIDSSTPGGRAMLSVLATFAQFEREQDAERVTMVHRQLAKDCRYLGGPVPLGYKIVDKHYQIDEGTAPVVRKLFAMYIAHEGYTAMLNYLNGTGLTTPTGKPFKKNSLNYILGNEKYIGTYIHNRLAAADRSGRRSSSRLKPETEIIRIPNGIPAIIDQATWDAACRIREENRVYAGRYSGHVEFLLSGLCQCAVCGQTIYVDCGGTDRNGTRQRYYTCHNKCVPAARKEPIEDAAFKVMASAALDEDMLIRACEIANSFLGTQQKDAAPEISRLKKRAYEISRQQANITDALAQASSAAPPSVLEKLSSLDQEKVAIEHQISKLQHKERFSSDEIITALNAVKRAKKLPPDLQKLRFRRQFLGCTSPRTSTISKFMALR